MESVVQLRDSDTGEKIKVVTGPDGVAGITSDGELKGETVAEVANFLDALDQIASVVAEIRTGEEGVAPSAEDCRFVSEFVQETVQKKEQPE